MVPTPWRLPTPLGVAMLEVEQAVPRRIDAHLAALHAARQALNHARIIGTGGYLPEKMLTNADLEQMIETTADWIVERTGVEERHVAAPGETTCDLAEQASRRALEAAGIEARDIDLIVLGTTTPDHVFPSVATQLQHRLGCHGGPLSTYRRFAPVSFTPWTSPGVSSPPARRGGRWWWGGYLHPHHRLAGSRYLHPVRRRCRRGGAGSDGRTGDHRQPAARRRPLKELLWVPAGVSSGYDQTQRNAAFVEMRGSEVFKVAVHT